MIYRNKVLDFCYTKLKPQLDGNNFNLILRLKIGKHEYEGRLIQIDELGYNLVLDMGTNDEHSIKYFKMVRIDEMEISGNAHNKLWEWKSEVKNSGN
jgi:hypothetical protein